MLRGRSAASESLTGLPLSKDSSCASSLMFSSMASASLNRRRLRSPGLIFDHGPDSNAFLAALTARSISALSPSATLQMVSPLVGLRVGNVLPETLDTH